MRGGERGREKREGIKQSVQGAVEESKSHGLQSSIRDDDERRAVKVNGRIKHEGL